MTREEDERVRAIVDGKLNGSANGLGLGMGVGRPDGAAEYGVRGRVEEEEEGSCWCLQAGEEDCEWFSSVLLLSNGAYGGRVGSPDVPPPLVFSSSIGTQRFRG